MKSTWNQRVSDYLDALATANETVELALDDMRLSTTKLAVPEVDASTQELTAAITSLEGLIRQRESLLHDSEAPQHGLTLVDKLLSTHNIDDARIAKRCKRVAANIEATHHRAVSLFVCHYHLTGLGADLLRILSGNQTPATYGKSVSQHRGGLFNEAA